MGHLLHADTFLWDRMERYPGERNVDRLVGGCTDEGERSETAAL